MSIDDLPPFVTCRDLVQSHIQGLVHSRQKASSDVAATDNECADLIQRLRDLSEDEPRDLSRSRLDAILRDRFVNLIASTDIFDPAFIEIWMILDLVTILSDHGCCEPALNYHLVEELLDSQGIRGCRKAFDYLEPRRERMVSKFLKEKKLVILRCFNELLRRLSRAEDTVFCGRVFIYMFQCFPLGEKSSVNLRGLFHTDNVTTFDPSPNKSDDAIKPMEIDTDNAQVPSGAQTPASAALDSDTISKTGRSTPLPRPVKPESKPIEEPPPNLDALYPKFWALQSIFSSPGRLFESSSMAEFKEGLAITLACFKSISTSTSSTTTTSASASTTGTKRKHSEIEGAPTTPFNPKYLTNRDLFDLEIHDLAFRRHFLVQSLMMLDFLLSLTPTSKVKVTDLLNWVPPPKNENETEEDRDYKVQPNKSVLYPYTLSSDDEKWCSSTRAQISTYLQSQGLGNEGRMYTRMVETVLSRDKNWVRWKAESCPLIKRKPIQSGIYLESQKRLVNLSEQACRPMPNPPGAQDFSFLNQTSSIDTLKNPSSRYKVPSLREYYNQVEADDLDMDFAETEEEKKDIEERKAGRVWRALRASVLEGRRVGLCEKLRSGNTTAKSDGVKDTLKESWNLKALIGEEDDEQQKYEPANEEVPEKSSNAPTPAAAANATSTPGTPAPPSDAATPVPPNDSAVSDLAPPNESSVDVLPVSPKPAHISLLPTAEESTPTPAAAIVAGTAIEGVDTPIPSLDGAVEMDETEVQEASGVVDENDGDEEGEDVEGEGEVIDDPGQVEGVDETMDDFAPGGMDDGE